MAFKTKIKTAINTLLRPLGLHLSSNTLIRQHKARMADLDSRNCFSQLVCAPLNAIENADWHWVVDAARRYQSVFEQWTALPARPGAFSLENSYFSSPDAQVLFAIVADRKPQRILEIGSGYSSMISRLAVDHADLATRIISIDPYPRADISAHVDESIQRRAELVPLQEFNMLKSGDVLFIDSSHEVSCGNDVQYLFLQVLPRLASGVLVHIHDILLPYEYPREWIAGQYGWNEQYVLAALLADSERYKVHWPGYWLQQQHSEIGDQFPQFNQGRAQSFWMEVK